MPKDPFCLRSPSVLKGGPPEPAAIFVAEGRIVAVESVDAPGQGFRETDAHGLVVLPGLVDSHVHVNEPGRTAWEGFATATRAAAAGGVTTVVDMPLNSSPVTTTVAALEAKAAAARGKIRVDVGFWGGCVPGNGADLRPLLRAGALGLKAFLVPSGIDDFPAAGKGDLRRGLEAVAAEDSVLLLHAEDPLEVANAEAAVAGRDPRRYETYLASRPPAAEVAAVETAVELSRVTGGRLHVVHVASAEALDVIARARLEGIPVTAETCPHYLAFRAGEIEEGATAFKCAPPIREESHREALWYGLERGDLDLVASDHSPAPPELKDPEGRGDFFAAWGGIASLQLLLPALWTEARRRGFGLEALERWLCRGPAELAGLDHRKGRIAPGYDADLVLFDPDRTFTVQGQNLQHRHPLTPYEGRTLQGVVERTYLRGHLVYDSGSFPGAPAGRWLAGRGSS